ncbi:hypothetical protein E5288_WYG018190 [Bos mutus]|uniref:Uncharacterized protein n=1 Tax=Bos mutus TaxID=72004 RepID=A0A6B0RGK8_9CETA|nr:hypothetical protein [Bos mutus]
MTSASDFWWEDEEKDQSLDRMLPCPVDQREEKTSSVFLWRRRESPLSLQCRLSVYQGMKINKMLVEKMGTRYVIEMDLDNKSGKIIAVLKFLMEVSLTIDTHPLRSITSQLCYHGMIDYLSNFISKGEKKLRKLGRITAELLKSSLVYRTAAERGRFGMFDSHGHKTIRDFSLTLDPALNPALFDSRVLEAVYVDWGVHSGKA